MQVNSDRETHNEASHYCATCIPNTQTRSIHGYCSQLWLVKVSIMIVMTCMSNTDTLDTPSRLSRACQMGCMCLYPHSYYSTSTSTTTPTTLPPFLLNRSLYS